MIRSRIAPTPSGYLHMGNAINFALNWLWTRRDNGILRLRIDDLDAPRSRPEYLDDIFRTLDWLGLDWDEGPQTADENRNRYAQNLRIEKYDRLITHLTENGDTFVCNCSRKDIQNHYQCRCREKGLVSANCNGSIRIITPAKKAIEVEDVCLGKTEIRLYEVMRDFVISRRDGIAAYQVASLADDIEFGTNLIIRGEDLLYSTAAQLYLAKLLGNKSFAQTAFYHHPLIKDEQGNKLSKSAGSFSMHEWRITGKIQADFYLLLSRFLLWENPATTLTQMLQGAKQGLPLMVMPA